MPLSQTTGSRAQVMHGNAKKTSGGLTKSQLKYNKQGKIVSKKASTLAKKNNRLVKAGYVTRKGVFGGDKTRYQDIGDLLKRMAVIVNSPSLHANSIHHEKYLELRKSVNDYVDYIDAINNRDENCRVLLKQYLTSEGHPYIFNDRNKVIIVPGSFNEWLVNYKNICNTFITTSCI
jgi:hypothetical protein